MSKSVEPSIAETAFSCPHCGAFTTQFWYKLFAEALGDDSKKTPFIPKRADKEKWKDIPEITAELLEWVDKMMSGLVFFDQLNCGHTCSADD